MTDQQRSAAWSDCLGAKKERVMGPWRRDQHRDMRQVGGVGRAGLRTTPPPPTTMFDYTP